MAAEFDIPYRVAIATSSFRRIVGFNIVADFGRLAYLTHLVAFVERDLGARPIAAGSALMISTLASLLGRLAAGYFADRFAVQRVAALTMAPFAAGVLVLAVASELIEGFLLSVALFCKNLFGTCLISRCKL